ncbi:MULTISPECIES: META domain-containing protein [unclassified Photobacterium]|uniref:META domain-containing protein n=1 Tax=unclassified Photobacterium TaxID=2628852 RepID=UPI001EE09A3D|nr:MULTISPECIES: META domain-containing protein [unclassified Photobacterium]MCG3866064.1 META domain-containing protein [Photobacterium sp. Ph6]MCG3877580.1 META domain-containing protein [Photobacterium sp. Ph5]
MKKVTLCLLALITISLTGCFSNQQLDKSSQMVGNWKLKGGLELPGITKRRPSVNIEPNMEVTGFTGCNLFKGKVEPSGDFSLPAVTHKMCLPELVKQENNMLNVLRSATSIEVINNSLIVDAGDKFLVFEKTNAS